MTRLNRLRVCIIAIAMVFTGIAVSYGQASSTGSPGTSIRTAPSKHAAATELKNFKSDPNNPEFSEARLTLLQNKAALEQGMNENSLTPEQISAYQARIVKLESKVNALKPADPNTANVADREKMKKDASTQVKASGNTTTTNIYSSKQCTRNQFLSLTEAQQRDVLVKVNDLEITDLVNADQREVNRVYGSVDIISVSEFRNLDSNKKLFILNNPDKYKIISNTTIIPNSSN